MIQATMKDSWLSHDDPDKHARDVADHVAEEIVKGEGVDQKDHGDNVPVNVHFACLVQPFMNRG